MVFIHSNLNFGTFSPLIGILICPLLMSQSIYILRTIFQPYAWESREYLRKLLVGKEVSFIVEHTIPISGRECALVYIGLCGIVPICVPSCAICLNGAC